MGDSAPQELGLSLPLCPLNSTSNSSGGGACMALLEPRSFSSTLVLTVVAALLCCLIVLSVATFHMHKSKMKRRKIQRAQEEYERDHLSPGEASGAGGSTHPGRQVMLMLGRSARHSPCALSPTDPREPRPSCTDPRKASPPAQTGPVMETARSSLYSLDNGIA